MHKPQYGVWYFVKLVCAGLPKLTEDAQNHSSKIYDLWKKPGRASSMTSDQKTFVLGLGAQKAGTSWVYHYLNADPAADFGGLKEYRVWDALELPEMGYFDVRPAKPVNRLMVALTSRVRGRASNTWKLRGHLQDNPENYFSYFKQRLAQPGISMTGDVTPTYSGLSADTLCVIRDHFKSEGIDVKVFFTMRDPISRAISAARMNRRKRDWRESVPPFGDFDRAILRYARSPHHDLIANYEHTVTQARSVFGADKVYLGLYETMFQLDEVARISRFMGATFMPERVKKRFYKSRSKQPVKEETKHQLREMFESTYQFAAREFPETRHLWFAPRSRQH